MIFTASQLEFMKEDVASNFSLSRIIKACKKQFKKEGRSFDAEFDKWKENKDN